MMSALVQMKPTCIEDIVALVALYRPGPMENIPKYCQVKNGLSERDYLHPSVDHILDETQGIIVYQEQVMQIAQEMAGYSLGGADLLRRAMGKKIQEAMDAERPKFLKGAAENGVDEKKALEVWNLLDKFANYGFNKSHAAAYAVVSYQTAWLKANHPVEFMAAVMNCDIHLTEKLAIYKAEVDRMGIEVLPPCVNRSEATFTVQDGKLAYALGALKNVGADAMRLIVTARGEKPFATLYDVARRVDLKRVGKRPLEMLARSGAFDALDANRARVLAALDALVAYSAAIHDQRGSAQVSLFGEAGEDLPEPRLPQAEDWMPATKLTQEHQAVGFYFSGHPLDDYMPALKRKGVLSYAEVEARAASGDFVGWMAGTVSVRQERKSQRGTRFAFVGLSDPTGTYEVMVFSEALEAARHLLEPGQNVRVQVRAEMQEGSLRLRAETVQGVDTAIASEARGLRVFLDDPAAPISVARVLERVASEGGRTPRGPIYICAIGDFDGGACEVDALLGEGLPVSPQIKGALKSVPGVVTVEEL
jgi:DNA polymerase-3 subunit alpha